MCEPIVVKNRQRRLEGGDDNVLALSAQGLTTLASQGPREAFSGAEVSPTLIATMPEAVFEDVRLWQRRPLETVSPLRSVECLLVKSRHDGAVNTTTVSVARGVT